MSPTYSYPNGVSSVGHRVVLIVVDALTLGVHPSSALITLHLQHNIRQQEQVDEQ